MTIPTTDKKTISVANHLFADILLKFGFPRILHLKNGEEFKSKLMEMLSQQLDIRKTFISPNHLQANRKLESSHRFIKDCVQKFSIDGVRNWINYTCMQQLHLIGSQMNTHRNHHIFCI